MPLYENVLPVGGGLQNPLGYDFTQVVSCSNTVEKLADQTSWLQDGVPACTAALGRGDRIGLVFIARSNTVNWNAGSENYDVVLDKDYLRFAFALSRSVQDNWVPGEMLRWYHCSRVGMQSNSTAWTKIVLLWEAKGGYAKVDEGSIEHQLQRLPGKMADRMQALAAARRAGGCCGVPNERAYGWLGAFPPPAAPAPVWQAARPRRWVMGVVPTGTNG